MRKLTIFLLFLCSFSVLASETPGVSFVAASGGGGGDSLPSQTGNTGKILTTDGSAASWIDPLLVNTSASNLTTGTIPDARYGVTFPAVSGVNLTALNATQLTSGTTPTARYPGGAFNGASELVQLTAATKYPAIDGSLITALNATQLTSGTVPDARFPGGAFNGASELVQLTAATKYPAIDGSLITSINATNSAITNDTTTNATMYPVWVTTTTGNLPVKISSTKMSFNPSTGMLTTTGITSTLTGNVTGNLTGNVTGNADTATSATSATTATNATNVGITNDTTTNATMYLGWFTANTGNLPTKVSSTKFTVNPSTGVLAAITFSGSGTSLTGVGLLGTAGSWTAVQTMGGTPNATGLTASGTTSGVTLTNTANGDNCLSIIGNASHSGNLIQCFQAGTSTKPFYITGGGIPVLNTAQFTGTTTINTGVNFNYTDSALTAGTMSLSTKGLRTQFATCTWTNAMVTALGATTSGNVKVCTLPARTVVRHVWVLIDNTAAGCTTLTVSIGRTSGGGYIDYVTASDCKVAAVTVYGNTSATCGTNNTGYDLPSYNGGTTDVYAQFNSTVQNLSSATTCTGVVVIESAFCP